MECPCRLSANVSRSDEPLEEILVFRHGEAQIGRTDAASEGSVGGAHFAGRPLLRVAELVELVPSMIAVQRSGSGKANRYFLRGFNRDHGTDFSTSIDDVLLSFLALITTRTNICA